MIEVSHLTKNFGGQTVVRDVSFSCAPGTVTGFLGQNGAGKSTTMRILCGLSPATAGTATVAGVPYRRLPNPGRTVGVLLDAGALHPGRTGRETLALAAMVQGVDRSVVPTLLERVGLPPAAARKRVGRYSLGMRQRLGLAAALVGDPQVLVLDEPANGLDPHGIWWMRGLLRDFADAGGTVLLSSHLLLEVEAVADRLVVISEGEVVASGTTSELLAAEGMTVRALDPAALAGALGRAGIDFRQHPSGEMVAQGSAVSVGRAAAEAGVVLLELRNSSVGLEQLFLRVTGQDPADPASPPVITEAVA